jgi:hypothetical protein
MMLHLKYYVVRSNQTQYREGFKLGVSIDMFKFYDILIYDFDRILVDNPYYVLCPRVILLISHANIQPLNSRLPRRDTFIYFNTNYESISADVSIE